MAIGIKNNFILPDKMPNRIILIYEYINESKKDPNKIDKVMTSYSDNDFETCWNKFVNDIFYRFYIDIKCLLIDLKTDALHNNQKVDEKTIINYIFDSNVQNIHSEKMENNEFKQN
jgi:hypothetical protein